MAGLKRPFQRDQQAGFAKGDDLTGRMAAIIASNGELPWAPEMTCGVDKLRNQNQTPMRGAFAQVYVQEAFRKFEPALRDVRVVDVLGADTMTLRVTATRADGKTVSYP